MLVWLTIIIALIVNYSFCTGTVLASVLTAFETPVPQVISEIYTLYSQRESNINYSYYY
jgi:hypothetical protein